MKNQLIFVFGLSVLFAANGSSTKGGYALDSGDKGHAFYAESSKGGGGVRPSLAGDKTGNGLAEGHGFERGFATGGVERGFISGGFERGFADGKAL